MAQYIDKAALVAEIEKRIKEIDEIGTYLSPKGVLTNLLCHIDTLEVKEYREEYDGFLGKELKMVDDEIERLEKLKVKEVDLERERMEECPYRLVRCMMYDGHFLQCRGACSWVVDYPKLKELKAQKGEEV